MLFLILCSLIFQTEEFVISFIGDSLTAGYGLRMENAYPALVSQKLESQLSHPIKVVNAGVSGDTTAGGLRRLNWQLRSKPDLVVIALGANDMLRGIPPEESKKNLEKMIKILQQKNIPIALIGMKAAGNLGKKYKSSFDQIFQQLSNKHKIPLFPFILQDVAKKQALNQDDGTHPNKKGHQVMAKNFSEFLAPIIKNILKREKQSD